MKMSCSVWLLSPFANEKKASAQALNEDQYLTACLGAELDDSPKEMWIYSVVNSVLLSRRQNLDLGRQLMRSSAAASIGSGATTRLG